MPAMSDREEQIDREIERFNEETDSEADKPGRIRVSLLRYTRAFPHLVIWWFVTLGVFVAGGALLHWSLFVPAALVLFLMNRHWRNLQGHFLSGCINPGVVLSVDPPLVAVSTDLSNSEGEFPVVKVLRQPLSMLVLEPATPGLRVATVALYEWDTGQAGRWDGFRPILADAATGNRAEIERCLDALGDEEWSELETGLEQVPEPYEPGTWRVYASVDRTQIFEPTREDVARLLGEHLGGLSAKLAHLPDELPGEKIAEAHAAWAAGAKSDETLAFVESLETRGAEAGLLVTAAGVWFGFPETGEGFFPHRGIVGAYADDRVLEVMVEDGRRLRIPERHFLTEMYKALEHFLEDVSRM
jgi:hypothetical protein